jgi:23S rRNA (cytosine1962-C5)-methyltransferase
VNSEGDDLSGLIVDRYGDSLAVQVTALAIATRLETICDALVAAVSPKSILLRGAERGLAKLEGLALPDRVIRGSAPAGPIFVHEHGLKFGVDLTEGVGRRAERAGGRCERQGGGLGTGQCRPQRRRQRDRRGGGRL